MARLTIASLTETLAAQGISLTKEKRGYTVVMVNGFSFYCEKLADVTEAVEKNRAYDDSLLTPSQVQEADVKAGTSEADYFDAEEQVDNINGDILTAVGMLARNTQSVRNEQLFNELHRQGLEPPNFANTTTAEDEELMGRLLVQDADAKRTPVKEELKSSVICRGFATNTPRVSAKLQRRAKRFHSALA